MTPQAERALLSTVREVRDALGELKDLLAGMRDEQRRRSEQVEKMIETAKAARVQAQAAPARSYQGLGEDPSLLEQTHAGQVPRTPQRPRRVPKSARGR